MGKRFNYGAKWDRFEINTTFIFLVGQEWPLPRLKCLLDVKGVAAYSRAQTRMQKINQ